MLAFRRLLGISSALHKVFLSSFSSCMTGPRKASTEGYLFNAEMVSTWLRPRHRKKVVTALVIIN